MASKKKTAGTKTTSTGAGVAPGSSLTNDVANASDVTVAAKLPPSPSSPVRSVSSALVTLLGDAQLQAALKKVEKDLHAFKDFRGQNLDKALALANEGAALTGVADRFENSVARIHARGVSINAALEPFLTALAHIAQSADPDSDIAQSLAAFATARAVTRGEGKRLRTAAKNKRAKKTPQP